MFSKLASLLLLSVALLQLSVAIDLPCKKIDAVGEQKGKERMLDLVDLKEGEDSVRIQLDSKQKPGLAVVGVLAEQCGNFIDLTMDWPQKNVLIVRRGFTATSDAITLRVTVYDKPV